MAPSSRWWVRSRALFNRNDSVTAVTGGELDAGCLQALRMMAEHRAAAVLSATWMSAILNQLISLQRTEM